MRVFCTCVALTTAVGGMLVGAAVVAQTPPVVGAASANEPVAAGRVVPRATPCRPRGDLPLKSYWNQPERRFTPSDYVAQFAHMEAFYDVPGEFGYIAAGERFGFEALSFIVTETQPEGGPPLHVHTMEEAHVLLEGAVEYQIGDRRFRAEGPYIARVPAGVPHTFVNRGDCPFNLIAVFPSKSLSYEEIGPNPLVLPADNAAKPVKSP